MDEKLEIWAIIDLFGHTQIAGKVTETTIGGCPFVRVDVPAGDKSPALTKFYGNGAIYSMTPVSEEVVNLFVKKYPPAPLNVYMPEIKMLPDRPERPVGAGRDDYEENDDERDYDQEDE